MRYRIALVAATSLPLALSGCAADGVPVTTATDHSARSVPVFPSVDGRVLERAEPASGDWLVRVRVADAEAGYAAAKQALVADGYTVTKDRGGTGGGDGQACTTRLCVSFTATDDPTAGPSVLYEVFRSTGVVG